MKNVNSELSIDQLSIFLDLMPIAISITSIENEEFVDVNTAFEKLFLVRKEMIIGRTEAELNMITSDSRVHIAKAFEKSDMLSEMEVDFMQPNVENKKILLSVNTIQMASKKYTIASMVDITTQKRIEKEFTEAREFAELATCIAEEAKAKAESATRIAENAVKAKQQFLSNMSHEIRTPMNAIIGFTKVILKTALTAKQKEYLIAIKMSGDALIVLINDILDLAKVDAGKMIFDQSPFKMELSVYAIMHLFELKIQEKNLELIKNYDTNIPDVLIGDSVRLHQILTNLISNAVKFTSEGSITIGVKMIQEDKEKVTIEFSVQDTGIGIPSTKLDQIFENFQQASSDTSRLYGGTGLGLAIVKQLVESQSGKMYVNSEVGIGSTFKFILNFQKTNANVETEITFRELSTNKKDIKILVVEDIVLNQLLMKTMLDDFGFECDISSNGKLAIAALEKKSYDIILMDLQMPEMNGFQTTEFIRNTLNLNIPIIALTADVTTVDLAKCKSVGMDDYLSKPVDERLLYHKILNYAKKAIEPISKALEFIPEEFLKREGYINLDYLQYRTKSNPFMLKEIIQAYVDQTPTLVLELKNSLYKKDWKVLSASIHQLLPSFAIVGIQKEYENMAIKIQDYANRLEETEDIHELVARIEEVCMQACEELRVELVKLHKQTNGKL